MNIKNLLLNMSMIVSFPELLNKNDSPLLTHEVMSCDKLSTVKLLGPSTSY